MTVFPAYCSRSRSLPSSSAMSARVSRMSSSSVLSRKVLLHQPKGSVAPTFHSLRSFFLPVCQVRPCCQLCRGTPCCTTQLVSSFGTHQRPRNPNQWSIKRSSTRFFQISPHVWCERLPFVILTSTPNPSKHRSVTRPKPGIFLTMSARLTSQTYLTGISRMNFVIVARSN